MGLGFNLWPIKGTCRSEARLDGKTVVITGGNCGIGKEVVRDLYWRGARVVLLCRDVEKAKHAMDEIKRNPPNKARMQPASSAGNMLVHTLDLGSFDSVRECAKIVLETESAIHILINNAGVYAPVQTKTRDGNEIHYQVNHLGHVLLTLLLLPKIRANAPCCRIVIMASVIHIVGRINLNETNLDSSYSKTMAYSRSKLANILFAQELTRRFKAEKIEGINVYMVHPGLVKSEIIRDMNHTICCGCHLFTRVLQYIGFVKNTEEGAQTLIHCAVSEKAANETGLYYSACKPASLASRGTRPDYIRRCWEMTCTMLQLDFTLTLDDLSNEAAKKLPARSTEISSSYTKF